MEIFNQVFTYLDESQLRDLATLQEEGAIYGEFWREEIDAFGFCRIRFKPLEIVEYVEASISFNEFLGLCKQYIDPQEALNHIKNAKIKRRVSEYNEWSTQIDQLDTLYCFAAFLGSQLEDLLSGGLTERYEFLNETYSGDRRFLLREILEMFSEATHLLQNRSNNRPSYILVVEQDIRDLLFTLIKPIFPDAIIEEFTPSNAGQAKRIDILIPQMATSIEIKIARSAQHAKHIADELKIDIESYHTHPACKTLLAFVWDKERYIQDRFTLKKDLDGVRIIQGKRVNFEVFIKP